ncbi:threonine/serine exporter family protein [Lactobacillus sp. S2-2]|uniref:threonine/serine exporter family protein n=1 Tax=Lactobacillus sp. S2-2 TaxID=2692917 RepID=UPI001F2AD7DC|nr:threonine/serine exporter family protein [Lactobacillus sp. S2-2]
MDLRNNLEHGSKEYNKLVVNICLLASRILIENGSEMSRVTDTINHIAKNADVKDLRSYVTITGIMLSVGGVDAQIMEVNKRAYDLRKIAAVNYYSRQFAEGKISITHFYYLLSKIDNLVTYFPFWMKMVAAALLSGAIEIVFQGNFVVALQTSIIGMLGWTLFVLLNKIIKVEFVNEFTSAVVIGVLALLTVKLGLGNSADDIIIGAVMPLVPGVQITNAVRDLMSGNLISGPARGIEAIIGACALGFGVALSLNWFG